MTKRICVVQARMGSSRLPGKVLKEVGGTPALGHELRRLRACPALDEIVVATTDQPEDEELARFVEATGHRVFRGPELDVLTRVVGAADFAKADVVVRVTGDCPLVDPWVAAHVIEGLTAATPPADYASNVLRRTYPRGLDVEAFHKATLERMDALATEPADREHVTTVVRATYPERFRAVSIEDDVDNSDMRWTLDEAADLEFLEALFARLELADRVVPYREIVAEVRSHPDLMLINGSAHTWSPSPGEVESGAQR